MEIERLSSSGGVDQPRFRIGWVVGNSNPAIASTRYRCLYPAVALRARGYKSCIFTTSDAAQSTLAELDVLVFVKRVDARALRLIDEAIKRDVRVYVDLCDNTLLPNYEKSASATQLLHLAGASAVVDAVITTTEALSESVAPYLSARTRFHVVPDQVETRETFAAAKALAKVCLHPESGAKPRQSGKRRRQLSVLVVQSRVRLAGLLELAARDPGQAVKVILRKGWTVAAQLSRPVVRTTKTWGLQKNVHVISTLAARTKARAQGFIASFTRRSSVTPSTAEDTVPITEHLRERALVMPLRHLETDVLEPSTDLAARPEGERPIVLWFGNHGSPHSNFGMLSLLLVAPALEKLATEIEFELKVISNSQKKFAAYIAPLNFTSRYVEWTPAAVFEALETAAVCIMPSSGDVFSRTKSANRAVMALANRVPVVASPLRSLELLGDAILYEDWETNIRALLTNSETRATLLQKAEPAIREFFSPDAIADRWEEAFALPHESFLRPASKASEEVVVGVALDLVQDLNVLLPLVTEIRKDGRLQLKLIISDRLAGMSPRVVRALLETGLVPHVVPRAEVLRGIDQSVRDVAALICASESTAGPHRYCHALTMMAREVGARTYTLQHGLENVGLTYFGPPGGSKVMFGSDTVLTWGPPAGLPDRLSPETRAKCVGVGRTTEVRAKTVPAKALPQHETICGVFENLHWERYSNAYRSAFIDDLLAVVTSRPEMLFLLKPHHAGKFISTASQIIAQLPANLIIADPNDPRWEPYTAEAMIPLCAAVVTTPSSVALDAAELGVPVAVAAYDIDAAPYAPLPLLRSRSEWQNFIDQSLKAPQELFVRAGQFRDRVRIPGNASARLIDVLLQDLAGSFTPGNGERSSSSAARYSVG